MKLKIVDLSRVLAGPLATMMLADLGADVIKVERPDGGDETRGWGPPFDELGQAAYFLSVNRNKRSLAADLTRPDDRNHVRQLIAEADVVVDNFRAGALAKLGLDPAELVADHPQLIWCSISGFGPDDPRPGYDFVVQAEEGWMAITGDPDGAPMKHGVALADVIAGKDAVIAILAALMTRSQRAMTSSERHVHVALASSARAALVNVAQNVLVGGGEARRWGNAHANLVPYQLFMAADRHIVIAVGSDAQWVACANALGLTALANDARMTTNAGRLAHRDEVVAAIAARIIERPAAEWMSVFAAAGVPSGLVRSVSEAIAGVGGDAQSGMPSATGGTVRLPPPTLGEHTAMIHERGWGAFA